MLFVVLVVYFWPGIRDTWGEIRWGMLALSCALFPVEMAFKVQRFRLLTRRIAGALSYRFAYLVYLAAYFVGVITPGRLGEFAKVHYLMKDKGVTAPQALRPTLVDRVFDLIFLLVVGVAGWAVLGIQSIEGSSPAKIAGLAALGVLVVTGPIWARPPVRALARRRLFGGRRARVLMWFDETLAEFYTRLGAAAAVLTLAAYAIGFFMAWLIARSAGIDEIPYHRMWVIMAVISLAMLLPVSVSGFGTREAAAVVLMGQLHGVPQERAISFSLLYFAVVNVFGGLLGLVCWLSIPLYRGKGFKQSLKTLRTGVEGGGREAARQRS